MDSMAKQWAAIRDISNGLCANLERVNSLVKELPSNYAAALEEVMKPVAPKSAVLQSSRGIECRGSHSVGAEPFFLSPQGKRCYQEKLQLSLRI